MLVVNFIKDKEGRNLSKSDYKILEFIERQHSTSASEIVSELKFSNRAIHYSLQRLVEREIIDRRPYLNDMRQTRYCLSDLILTEFRARNQIR